MDYRSVVALTEIEGDVRLGNQNLQIHSLGVFRGERFLTEIKQNPELVVRIREESLFKESNDPTGGKLMNQSAGGQQKTDLCRPR